MLIFVGTQATFVITDDDQRDAEEMDAAQREELIQANQAVLFAKLKKIV